MTPDSQQVRRALNSGQFVPFFQPIVAVRTGKLVGFEVLARWDHPEMGIIAPDVFIPLAEKDGWIRELTAIIIRSAFASAAALLPSPLTISINISPLELHDAELTQQIRNLAEEAGFSLRRTVIEITESALAENPTQAYATVSALKELGCRIALDDFGTGYSSLRQLQSMPFDELKVDRSFVSSMTERRDSRKIVAAVIGMGQSLGLTTVAEGVETQEQADMLLWLGCDEAQGWLYGRPVPARELAAVIAAQRERPTAASFRWKNLTVGNLEGLPSQRLAQLQAVYDGAPVALGFLDRGLKYVNLNRRLADMHRKPLEEHFGRTISEVVPGVFAQIAPFLNRALRGEAVTDVEVKGSQPEETFLASYQPARDEAGEVVGISCAVIDFTARKRAEERLRQFERLVEGLEEMMAVVDRDYRFVLANRAYLRYRVMREEELVGRRVSDIVGSELFDGVLKAHFDECFNGGFVHFALRYRYPELGERDLDVSLAPVEMAEGVSAAACIFRDVTDIRRLERAETGWRKRIELAQQAGLRIGLWDWDIDANTVIWSDETYRQWGFTPETFSSRVEDAVTRIHHDDGARVALAIARVLSGEAKEFAEQYRIVRPDGSTCWIDAHGVMLQDEGLHMMGVGVDITGLKTIQRSLEESEEKYLLLLNSTAEAIYGLDLNGLCTFCNPACLRLLGYEKPADLLGKNMHQLMHHTRPDGTPYPTEECVIYRAIREGVPSHLSEEVLWRADGSRLFVEYWSHPMFRNGEPVGAVVTFLDLTERRRAEEARRASEAQYRELFENATYGIVVASEDGTLLDANPAVIRMLGYGSKEELLERNLQRDIELWGTSEIGARECEWMRKDGKTITVHLSSRAIRGPDGAVTQTQVIAEDVTERRSLEEQFRRAQKMEAVGQLAGGIAHDFNNLLTIINGYSDLLLHKLDRTDPERHLVEQIKDAGWRSAALTKQLLVFSRKQIVRPSHIDLNPVIANLEVMLRRIIGEDIALRSSLSAEPCPVLADRRTNRAGGDESRGQCAGRHAGRRRARHRNVARCLDDAYAAAHVNVRGGAYVVLTVRDTGAGMTEEVKNHLFEPFFTTKGPDKGTGLGLAVVHGIVRDCEGHIEVESQSGRGTTFRIFLPMAAVPSGQSAPVATEEQASRGGAETILLVEDDAAVRALTSHILSARGYFVLEAANGVAGLRIARSYTSRIDLLATDIVMPGITGRQLALAMRDSHPETRVLYLSGYSDTSFPRRAPGRRKEYLIEKPFKPEALAVKVREVLDAA